MKSQTRSTKTTAKKTTAKKKSLKTYTFKNSQKLFQRALKVIPCGIYGHFSPAPLIPATSYPFYAERAKGSHFWDVDGNEFIDYMCAYGPMVLGYNHPGVDQAAMKQLKRGNCITAPTREMVELAEQLVDLNTAADWAFFAKNGGDVVNQSIMLARAATGRTKMMLVKGGYHGVSSWMQGPGHYGVVEQDCASNVYVDWNNIQQVENAVSQHRGEIAAFLATPYHHPTFGDSELPADGYWQKIRQICDREGIVLIIDDVRCGFRIDMRGSHEYFGFKPDLACYCKAIGNGYPISALVGREELKTYAAKVFYTGSYWFSSVPMAAAIACMKEMKKINAPRVMIKQGKKLWDGIAKMADGYGYDMKVSGMASMPTLRITNDPSMMLHQDWCAEATRRGAYFTSHHNWFISAAHTDTDIKKTLDIADEAFKAVKKKYGDEY